MKKIYDFQKDDIIVRVEPAKTYGGPGGVRDRSYLGSKLVFVGIANGSIYLQRTEESTMYSAKLLSLSIDVWDDGWNFYFEPNQLLNGINSPVDHRQIKHQVESITRWFNTIANEDIHNLIRTRQ